LYSNVQIRPPDSLPVADSEIVKRGLKTMYQPRCHLS